MINKLYDRLNALFEDIKSDDNFSKLMKIMNTEDVRNMFDRYIEMVEEVQKNKDNITEDEIRLLRLLLQISNSIYNYSGETTGISDAEYDYLIEFYKDISGDDSIITEPLTSDEKVAHHKYKTLRGTLDKIYKITDEDVLKNKSQKSLEDWVQQTERRYKDKTGETIDLMEEEVIVMPKFDGVSCIFECEKDGTLIRALTRGDTARNEAQDITNVFKDFYKGPITDAKEKYGHKTEVMMLDSDFDEVNEKSPKKYKNTRSIVSSILNSDENDGREKYLHVVPLRYSYLNKDNSETQQYLSPGVYDYPYLKCKLKDVDKIHEFAFNHKTVYPGFRCDGAVIRLTDEKIQKILGRENEKQKFEVAFKFTEEVGYTKVKDVIFTTGLFGRLNPVVVMKPIKLKGNTIERASLGSYSRFKKLELCKGDTIKVLYDIIPYVIYDDDDFKCNRSGDDVIEAPNICPDCGKDLKLSDTGDILYCDNKKCPCREKGKILNFCKKMNIGQISYATIDDFYREGYLSSIHDIYMLKDYVKELSKISGYGNNKINNILKEIDTHRDVIPSTLLGSIGIEGLGPKTFKNILSYMNMDELKELSNDKNYGFFTVIPGIKEKTSTKLVDGILENMDLLTFLESELNIITEPNTIGEFSVVFSKVRDEDMEQFIRDNGGIVSDSLTKDTDILVVPVNGTNSSKVTKAKKYDIPVVPLGELVNYINANY